jgi:hypothetical protein
MQRDGLRSKHTLDLVSRLETTERGHHSSRVLLLPAFLNARNPIGRQGLVQEHLIERRIRSHTSERMSRRVLSELSGLPLS